LADLTPRESQVLDGIMASKANKEIAADLGISVRAVESHRARLMERTGSQGVSELVQTVMRARDESAVDSEIA
jgi:FixJ family two-component response regulator